MSTTVSWNSSSFLQHLSLNSYVYSDKTHKVQTHTTVSPIQGFHITSTTTISGLDIFLPETNCFAGSLQFVPPGFIIDEYELNQRYQEGYGPLCHVIGERDLELPVHAVGGHSAAILAEIPLRPRVRVDIPLHLRYASPLEGVKLSEVQLPWPWVVVKCDGQVNIGRELLDEIFGNRTTTSRYTLIPPDTTYPSTTILVPTGNISHQIWVEMGTLLSVFLAFVYVAWCLLKPSRVADTKLKKS
ncbi:PIG-X [Rhizoctonia solani]|nr:PIG-X [Rhizoctonia solani]